MLLSCEQLLLTCLVLVSGCFYFRLQWCNDNILMVHAVVKSNLIIHIIVKTTATFCTCFFRSQGQLFLRCSCFSFAFLLVFVSFFVCRFSSDSVFLTYSQKAKNKKAKQTIMHCTTKQ